MFVVNRFQFAYDAQKLVYLLVLLCLLFNDRYDQQIFSSEIIDVGDFCKYRYQRCTAEAAGQSTPTQLFFYDNLNFFDYCSSLLLEVTDQQLNSSVFSRFRMPPLVW